jgi:Ran GTPase-activating protein (RanGAP) involved in mRNA processing and transport
MDDSTYFVEGTGVLSDSLQINEKLSILNLSCTRLTIYSLKEISFALKYNSTLKELHLGQNQMKDECAEIIADMIYANKYLNRLDLSGNDFTSTGARLISLALRQEQCSLVDLDLSQNMINDEGACIIADILKINKSLNKLDLSSNTISSMGVEALTHGLQYNKSLKDLRLSHSEISFLGIKSIALTLQQGNSYLTHIDLSYGMICDDGAREIAKMLEFNKILKNLDLYENRITSTGIITIAFALRRNDYLTELNLSGNCDYGDAIDEILVTFQDWNDTIIYFPMDVSPSMNRKRKQLELIRTLLRANKRKSRFAPKKAQRRLNWLFYTWVHQKGIKSNRKFCSDRNVVHTRS